MGSIRERMKMFEQAAPAAQQAPIRPAPTGVKKVWGTPSATATTGEAAAAAAPAPAIVSATAAPVSSPPKPVAAPVAAPAPAPEPTPIAAPAPAPAPATSSSPPPPPAAAATNHNAEEEKHQSEANKVVASDAPKPIGKLNLAAFAAPPMKTPETKKEPIVIARKAAAEDETSNNNHNNNNDNNNEHTTSSPSVGKLAERKNLFATGFNPLCLVPGAAPPGREGGNNHGIESPSNKDDNKGDTPIEHMTSERAKMPTKRRPPSVKMMRTASGNMVEEGGGAAAAEVVRLPSNEVTPLPPVGLESQENEEQVQE